MAAVQRRGTLRIANSYRTVSEAIALVIAGVTIDPTDLLAKEEKHVYLDKMQGSTTTRREIGQCIVQIHSTKFIKNISVWMDREHGKVNCSLTHGHGYFHYFLCKIGQVNIGFCVYQDSDCNNVHHIFFESSKWKPHRDELEQEIGVLKPKDLIEVMLGNRDIRCRVSAFVKTILTIKKQKMHVF